MMKILGPGGSAFIFLSLNESLRNKKIKAAHNSFLNKLFVVQGRPIQNIRFKKRCYIPLLFNLSYHFWLIWPMCHHEIC